MDMNATLHTWAQLRSELRAAEVSEHPPITDPHGRIWYWKDQDLYTHDDTLAIPSHMIPTAGLPSPGLADRNPNYSRLCAICRHA